MFYFAPALINLAELSRYDIVAAALQTGLLCVTLATIVVYLSKRSGNRTANYFFVLLLLAFGACIGDLILDHLGLQVRYPRLRYLPVWLTFAIGPCWFYYVKLSLFPAYKLRLTDSKHAVLPVSQVLYYVYCFWSRSDGLSQEFMFGFPASTFEEALFMASVLGYLLGAYRYLRFRARDIGEATVRWDYWWVRQLRHIQRVLVVLLVFNFSFVVYNFVVEQTVGTSLLHLRSFYASSSLSFGLILLYLLRGVAHRQHFSAMVPPDVLAKAATAPGERLRILMETGRGSRDPNAHEVRAARAIDVGPEALSEIVRDAGATTWTSYLRGLRLRDLAGLRDQGIPMREATLMAGFASRAAALRALNLRHEAPAL